MPLDSTNFTQNGTNTHQDHLQFFNLLTGVMTDQPVRIANTVTVGGNALVLGAASAAGPFITPAVSGSLLFGTNNQVRWAIDFSNGQFQAQADNSYDIGQAASNRPRSIFVATSLTVPAINTQTLAATTSVTSPLHIVGTANERIRNPVNGAANLSVESADGQVTSAGKLAVYMGGNAYLDGTSWQRFDTAQPYSIIGVSPGWLNFYSGVAGANPATDYGVKFSVDGSGNGLFHGTLASLGQLTANANLALAGDFLINPTSVFRFNNGATLSQWSSGADNRVIISALTVTPGPTAVAAFSANGAFTSNSTVVFNQGATVAGGTLNISNLTIQYLTTMYGVNNGCYLTNNGADWTFAGGNLTTSGSLWVNGSNASVTISQAGNGVITTGAGDLYIRSTSGNVRFDSGSIFSPSAAISTVYFSASIAAPYLQNAGAALRYYATGVHSFEGSGQINCTIMQFSSSINSNGAVWRCDGVQNIVTLAPGGSQHWFMTNGQAGWATVYGLNFANQSARRSKDNIRVLEDPLSIVLDEGIHGVRYTERSTGDEKVGFIADDWLGVLPEIVGLDDIGDVAMLDYDRIGAVTFEALKQYAIQTNARLKTLEAKLAA
jgi:hypothetical protein